MFKYLLLSNKSTLVIWTWSRGEFHCELCKFNCFQGLYVLIAVKFDDREDILLRREHLELGRAYQLRKIGFEYKNNIEKLLCLVLKPNNGDGAN